MFMSNNTSIPRDIMVKLLKDYMLNPKLSKECMEFLSKIIIETHTEEEISMYASISINNIMDKINPPLINDKDYVRIHGSNISSWKITELGNKDLLIDSGIYDYNTDTYLGYVDGIKYKDEYIVHYPTKNVALFNIDEDLNVSTTTSDFTHDKLIALDLKEKMSKKWSDKVINHDRFTNR